MKIEAIPLLSDNYAWLLSMGDGAECALVDPSESAPILSLLKDRSLTPRWILATHHHSDHVGGISGILAEYPNTDVVCSKYDKDRNRIPGATLAVADNDELTILGQSVRCLSVPGHTLGAVAFYFSGFHAVFTGDTLFTSGCGRLFEGTPEQMHASLSLLRDLPRDTDVYCGHEYTEKNLNFGLSLLPEDRDIIKRLNQVKALREAGQPSVPASIEIERCVNPFLRSADPLLQEVLGTKEPVATFAETRRRRDSF
jgi:hydroxyacylglutathione hydrolase